MLYLRIAESSTGEAAADAARLGAIALVGAGEPTRASGVMARAYESSEALRRRPVGVGVVGGRDEMSRLASVAWRAAREGGSSDSWLLAAVLSNASGDGPAAREALRERDAAEARSE